MKTLFKPGQYFDEDYYERGAETGKSLYSHYRWMPELTIPMCHHIAKYLELKETDKVLSKVSQILSTSEENIYINGDPRGYALKFSSSFTNSNLDFMYRDFGGYGIIAPDFREV